MVVRWYRSLGVERNALFTLSSRNTGSSGGGNEKICDIMVCTDMYIISNGVPEGEYIERLKTRMIQDELTIT